MVWLQSATRRMLGPQQQPAMHQKDIICFHTMVGFLTTTFAMFKQSGFTGTESHFGVGGKWGIDRADGLDGAVWQFQDTDFTADANFRGSWHILSVEFADNAPRLASGIEPMTPAQVSAAVELFADLCLLYDIPPVLVPDTKVGRRGLAYHFQGVPPNLVHDGELWSAAGHECPGPARIHQIKTEIIPKIAAEVKRRKETEKDMQWGDKVKLTATDAKVWGGAYKEGDEVTVGLMVRYPTLARKNEQTLERIEEKVDRLLDADLTPPATKT